MNQSLLLHVVERLEGLVGRLPATIQKPILSELTPLKELFLRQRGPRFLFAGSGKTPLPEILRAIFPDAAVERTDGISIENRWQDIAIADRGSISVLDARTASEWPSPGLKDELARQSADIIFFVNDTSGRGPRKNDTENLIECLRENDKVQPGTKVIALLLWDAKSRAIRDDDASSNGAERKPRSSVVFETKGIPSDRLNAAFQLRPNPSEREIHDIWARIARELPNEARIEMARLTGNREAQAEIAHLLVKSTTAISTAIGAQPIPLADLPILTTLQLVMVSGIMYVSGRERSLRAATEFVGALGANVGVGMLLREGARAVLKFFPGWGNVVCGMVAGAGTYAIGRAATVFFVEGVSLKDARRIYAASRKKSGRPKMLEEKRSKRERIQEK